MRSMVDIPVVYVVEMFMLLIFFASASMYLLSTACYFHMEIKSEVIADCYRCQARVSTQAASGIAGFITVNKQKITCGSGNYHVLA